MWAINICDKLSLIKFSSLRCIAQNNLVCVPPDSGQRCKANSSENFTFYLSGRTIQHPCLSHNSSPVNRHHDHSHSNKEKHLTEGLLMVSEA